MAARPFYQSPEPEPERRPSPLLGLNVDLSSDIQDQVAMLVDAINANSALVAEYMQRPPYVVVQPHVNHRVKRTPVRDDKGRILYVIEEVMEDDE